MGESHHPLRLAQWVGLEVVAYIYIRYMQLVEFVGHSLRLACYTVE